MDKSEVIIGVIGFFVTVAIGIMLYLYFDSLWGLILAFVPYNVYEFAGWRDRNKPKDRTEMYKTIAILIILPFAIAFIMYSLNSYVY